MTIRRKVDGILPVLGIVLVLGAVLFLWRSLLLQVTVVVVGIFLIEAGIWKLAHPLLPTARKYRALRDEVDEFIQLVRRLNTAAIERQTGVGEAEERLEAVRAEMLASVDRMVTYAGSEARRDALSEAPAGARAD